MATIKVDCDKLRESGNRILSLANDYENVLKEYIDRLEKVEENHLWNGNSAKAFVERVKSDKTAYFEMGKVLKRFGKTMLDFSNDMSIQK